MTTLDFEKNFNYNYWRIWMSTNWKLPIYISVLHVLGIFVRQKWMKDRLPYKLERSLKIWNFLLAAFSVAWFLCSFPEVVFLLNKSDRYYQVSCGQYDHKFNNLLL